MHLITLICAILPPITSDVVVDSVTRPSMSATGFVTFKTLTPVTVSTSAPLTFNSIPMEVVIAPEPREIVWQNVPVSIFVTIRVFSQHKPHFSVALIVHPSHERNEHSCPSDRPGYWRLERVCGKRPTWAWGVVVVYPLDINPSLGEGGKCG